MCVKSGHAFEFQETRDTAKGRRMVKTWGLNGKCEDELCLRGFLEVKTKQLGCGLLVTLTVICSLMMTSLVESALSQ